MSTTSNPGPVMNDPWDEELSILHKIKPPRFHRDYLHLVDLNKFIKSLATQDALTILDYGAGASPYRQYFPNADYRRADITGSESLQYQIAMDSKIAEKDETFDLILSTQVAEHLPNPNVYFQEAYRLLKPGGRMILSTHGIWDEHGSPYDFQRWTPDGLRRDLAAVGFGQMTAYKLTCGLRAACTIFTRTLYGTTPPQPPVKKVIFKSFRWLYSKLLPVINRICDTWWPQDMIFQETEGERGPTWYLVVAVLARK